MEAMLFVVSAIIQCIPFGVAPLSSARIENSTYDLKARFSESAHVDIGSPVFLQGKHIGNVVAVNQLSIGKASKKAKAKGDRFGYEVQLKLDAEAKGEMVEGTVALLSAHMRSSKKAHTQIIEIVPPKDSSSRSQLRSDQLKGYSSFEEYWRG